MRTVWLASCSWTFASHFFFLQSHEPGDDWSEHISSSGKKYYYNCRTEVSQWEKPKEWLERYLLFSSTQTNFNQCHLKKVGSKANIYLRVYMCLFHREQRQKDATKTVVNSFPKDRDYRREAMQASTAPTGSSKSCTVTIHLLLTCLQLLIWVSHSLCLHICILTLLDWPNMLRMSFLHLNLHLPRICSKPSP